MLGIGIIELIKFLFKGKAFIGTMGAVLAAFFIGYFVLNKNNTVPENKAVAQVTEEVKMDNALTVKNDKEVSGYVNNTEQRRKILVEQIRSEKPAAVDIDKLSTSVRGMLLESCQARSSRDSSGLCGGSSAVIETNSRR